MRAFALIALPLALTLLSPSAGAAEDGIQGRVVNGSRAGGSTEGLIVTILPGSPQGEGITTRTNAYGEFAFPGLSLAKGTYTIAVRYKGLDYAERLEVTGAGAEPLLLSVYENTTDLGGIKVLLDHHIVEVRPEEKRVNIVNYLQVLNTSDLTAVLGEQPSVAGLFPVAEGAENVDVVEGPSHIASDPGRLVRALPPGEHKLLLAYELPYDGSQLLFRRPVAYATERAVLIISDNDGRAESAQLPHVEEVENASGSFYLLSGEALQTGGVLEVQLSGFPAPLPTARSFLWMVPVIALVVTAGVALMLYIRLRGRRAQTAAAG